MKLLAIIIAGAAVFLFWTAPDRRGERDAAANIERRVRDGQHIDRLAQETCGENAGWRIGKDGGSIQCTTKHGRMTGSTAKIQ
jgi:hypothetical protein